jgi:LacI family transcriptional regulator
MHNKNSQVKLIDIANAASVSVATVSRALGNNGHPVSEDLRKKILKISNEMGYVPNLIGRQLKLKKTNDIGVIIPSLTNPFYPAILQGLEIKARKRNYNIFLCNSYRDARIEEIYLKNLYQKQVSGIIISSISKSREIIEDLVNRGIEIVTFDQYLQDINCSAIYVNCENAGYMAAQYFFELGHKKVAIVNSPLDRYSRIKVLEGFKRGLSDFNIKIKDEYIKVAQSEQEYENEIYEFNNGKEQTEELMKLPDLPTGIFATNDMTAYGVIQKLNELRIKVPEEVSVIGFNNIATSVMINPPLTTINQPMFQMGELAANVLIDRIEGIKKEKVNIELQPRLIVRNSTSYKELRGDSG